MLEKSIEIEGLLRIIRDGNPLPETYRILIEKTAELAESSLRLQETDKTHEPEKLHADFVMAPPPMEAPAQPEVVFAEQEALPTEPHAFNPIENFSELPNTQQDFSNDDTEDLALAEEDDIILTFDETPDTQPEISEEAQTDEVPNEIEDKEANKEEDNKEENIEENKEESKDEASSSPLSKPRKKIRSSFSINDRFLYARELFNGNMKMFDSTLKFLEGIEDFSIIEDYFYTELEWNPEDVNVATFMEILRPNFN